MDINDKIFKDFQHELSIRQFSFHNLIINNNDYKEYLYQEFEQLSPRPKFYLYSKEFISDEDWAKDRTENRGYMHTTNSKEAVATHFVPTSELESKLLQLHSTFTDKIVKNLVEEKYLGRFIEDMKTYKILNKLNNALDNFKEYVFIDDNINNYRSFANAAAKQMILQINKLNIKSLKLELLEHLVEISTDKDFKILLWLKDDKSNKNRQLTRSFNYLKTHADEVFSEEITKQKTILETYKIVAKKDDFKHSRYEEMNFIQLISEGEGKYIEFKRTLKLNLETNIPDNKSKHAIAKTLAAFLNSGGGALLIGVDDRKNIIGLESDFRTYRSRNSLDKFKNEFDELVSSKLGSNYHHLIDLSFHVADEKKICLIIVEGSIEPVYCFNEANISKEFYIRRQASTIALKINEVTPYINSNWS